MLPEFVEAEKTKTSRVTCHRRGSCYYLQGLTHSGILDI